MTREIVHNLILGSVLVGTVSSGWVGLGSILTCVPVNVRGPNFLVEMSNFHRQVIADGNIMFLFANCTPLAVQRCCI